MNIYLKFIIIYINFTKDNLEQFVKSCTKAEKLCLTWSNFNFDSELDFSGSAYNIAYLGFKDAASHSSNNWSTKPERFGNIVKAIALSGLKESLKTINIQNTGLTIDQVQEMLKTNKIEHINVVQEAKEPH